MSKTYYLLLIKLTIFFFIGRFSVDISYDDTEGQFILGGVDPTLGSFLGYMGLVKLYRGRTLTLEEVMSKDFQHSI